MKKVLAIARTFFFGASQSQEVVSEAVVLSGQMNKKIKRNHKKITHIFTAATAVAMLAFTSFVFTFIADLYVKPCPEYTEFGACKLEYGLSASVMGTVSAVVWAVIAVAVLIVSAYKLKKSGK